MKRKVTISSGYTFSTIKGDRCEVVSYQNAKEVWVQFLDDTGYIRKTSSAEIRLGKIFNPFKKDTFGIGYLGIFSKEEKSEPDYLVAYTLWRNMFSRCYSKNFLGNSPTYIGCTVSEDFHSFKCFYIWCKKQKNFNRKGFQLDKDILSKGNKVYSPNTCRFVPKSINCILLDRRNHRGVYPQGVISDRKKFSARVSVQGKTIYLGSFDCEKEAYNCYKRNKEAYIKDEAINWREELDEDVYLALMNYAI